MPPDMIRGHFFCAFVNSKTYELRLIALQAYEIEFSSYKKYCRQICRKRRAYSRFMTVILPIFQKNKTGIFIDYY